MIFAENMFSCLVCNRSYLSKKSLNRHMRIHDDSKSINCDVCLKNFPSKSHLEQHYRIHTGQKPFACQICDRKFAQKSNLVQHQTFHSEIKSYKCSICPEDRFFKTKVDFRRHMIYHYEPKFSCNQCDHKSYRKSDLTKHEKTHVKN